MISRDSFLKNFKTAKSNVIIDTDVELTKLDFVKTADITKGLDGFLFKKISPNDNLNSKDEINMQNSNKRRFPRWLKRNIAYPLEALIAYFLLGIMKIIGYKNSSNVMAKVFSFIGPRISLSNKMRRRIKSAFPDYSDAEVENVVVGSWINFGRMIGEFPFATSMNVYNSPHITVKNIHNFYDAVEQGNGVFAITIHFGNWEYLASALVYSKYGDKFSIAYREPNNPFMNKFYMRNSKDGLYLPRGKFFLRKLIRLIKQGGGAGLLIDQKFDKGIEIDFLGQKVKTMSFYAEMALNYNMPLVMFKCLRRKESFGYDLEVFEAIKPESTGDFAHDVHVLVQKINNISAEWIKDCPEQWFWQHNRW